jgi:hypothetical protein
MPNRYSHAELQLVLLIFRKIKSFFFNQEKYKVLCLKRIYLVSN